LHVETVISRNALQIFLQLRTVREANSLKISSDFIHSVCRLPTAYEGVSEKFPDWPPGARNANGIALLH
jgi:hypothetical protein